MTAPRIALAGALLAALAAFAIAAALGTFAPAAWLARVAVYAEPHRHLAAASFVAVYVVAAMLAVPGSILTLAAGLLFGLPLGVALTSAGSVLGASAAFAVGRFAARDWVARRVVTRPRLQALVAATGDDGFWVVLLARLSPLIPYNLLNYALSVTAVRFRDYALATWLGMLPATVLYVYAGSLAQSLAVPAGAARAPSWAAHALLVVGFVATAALTWLIARRATRALRDHLAAGAPRPVAGGVR